MLFICNYYPISKVELVTIYWWYKMLNIADMEFMFIFQVTLNIIKRHNVPLQAFSTYCLSILLFHLPR